MVSVLQPVRPTQRPYKEFEQYLRDQRGDLTPNELRARLIMDKAMNVVNSSKMGKPIKDDNAHEAHATLAAEVFAALWHAGEDENTFIPKK